MDKRLYKSYLALRNMLYKNKVIRRVYSYFMTDLPDKRARKRLHTYGYQDLAKITDALDREGIRCFCEFGTLLGFIRDNGFIPHDIDVDMAILDEGGFSWDRLEKALNSIGMKKIHACSYHGKLTEQSYSFDDGVSVDFFLYEEVEGDKIRTLVYYKDHTISYSHPDERSVKALVYPGIHGLQRLEIQGCVVWIPRIRRTTWKRSTERHGECRTPVMFRTGRSMFFRISE